LPAPRRQTSRKFLDQFRNFLVIVLLGAAVPAGTVGDIKAPWSSPSSDGHREA
jgi:hypothetical protein